MVLLDKDLIEQLNNVQPTSAVYPEQEKTTIYMGCDDGCGHGNRL